MTIDRRVMRTRAALYDSLVELVRERDYDTIRVQDILERANIGRSTFYAHFKSKDELLERSLERLRQELLATVETTPDATIFDVTRALFKHIDRHRDIHFALADGTAVVLVHEAVATNFSQVVRSLLPSSRTGPIPRELAISHIRGSFLCVLRWWMDRNPTVTPEAADDLFCGLVFGGLGDQWGTLPERPSR